MKTSLEIKKIKKKRQIYCSRKKDKKTQEYLREKALTEKWQEKKKKYDVAYNYIGIAAKRKATK